MSTPKDTPKPIEVARFALDRPATSRPSANTLANHALFGEDDGLSDDGDATEVLVLRRPVSQAQSGAPPRPLPGVPTSTSVRPLPPSAASPPEDETLTDRTHARRPPTHAAPAAAAPAPAGLLPQRVQPKPLPGQALSTAAEPGPRLGVRASQASDMRVAQQEASTSGPVARARPTSSPSMPRPASLPPVIGKGQKTRIGVADQAPLFGGDDGLSDEGDATTIDLRADARPSQLPVRPLPAAPTTRALPKRGPPVAEPHEHHVHHVHTPETTPNPSPRRREAPTQLAASPLIDDE